MDRWSPDRGELRRRQNLATANFIWKGNITDTINGFRAVRKAAIERLRIDAQGFVIEYQMSIRAMKLGLKVAEIPTIEGDRIGGESTAKSIPTGLKMLRCLLGEIWIGKRFADHQLSEQFYGAQNKDLHV